ncbi:MAG: 1-deoxy-D-xylulose-5-phosphate reductoisomerase [Phycisphaerae bacterium]
MKKRVIILGSTGSVGRSTLEVLSECQADWQIVGLAAGSRGEALTRQANVHRPEALAIADGDAADSVRSELAYEPTLYEGKDALVRLVEETPFDCLVSAVVGAGGLSATLKAVELGRRVALANKEALVIAGSLLMPLARKSGATLIPVDSEHSAVFQAMHAGRPCDVRRIHLTTSGGPFRTWTTEAMEAATPDDALKHPTWRMGPKITIDSATMMNKALEIVEARWLFDLTPDRIGVVVHPESIIHALVEFQDGSMIAQLSAPDMRTPIQYALTYPQRRSGPGRVLDLTAVGRLNFEPPEEDRFPALRLGREVAARGGTAGAVLNAANEAAVSLFRGGQIGYHDIARLTEQALERHAFKATPDLDDLLAADRRARERVSQCTV